jgi:hypothetical protein
MKRKFFLPLILLVGMISLISCDSDDDKTNPDNILAENMITVVDVTGIQVLLDNPGKTIDITIPYESKDKIGALTLLFSDLPAGAMVAPLNQVMDFSANKRHDFTVTFADGEVKVYSVGVTYGALQPKFTELTLNGVTTTVENSVYTAQLLASEDLSAVKIHYTTNNSGVTVKIKNMDNDDYVTLDTTAVNNKYNFSDKLNGRKIKLEYNGASSIVTVKVITSGYSKITKVWQTFANFGTPDFYGVTPLAGTSPSAVVPASASTDAWDRGIAMDDEYIYLARGNKHMSAESATPPLYPAYGIIAVKISDKSARLLDRTGMYTSGETGLGSHGTTDVNVIGGKIVACNLANLANSNLKVFVWDNVNAAPRTILTYNVGASPNPRLGDKFTFDGDWTSGVFRFYDYNGGNNRYYEFKVTNGVVSATPTIVTVTNLTNAGNTAGGVYKFSDTEFLYSGSGKMATVFNPQTATVTYTTDGAVFPLSEIGDAFFTFNDKKYLAYIFQKNTGYNWAVRIRPLDYPTLAESLQKISNKTLDFNLSGLLTTDMSAVTNGNSTGKVYIHKTASGVTYLLALASNQGFGLFKIE